MPSRTTPFVTLMGDSTPLGHAVDLEEGDVVLMLTDWAIEIQSPDGELFGVSRAIECVSANRDRSAREIIDCLYETVLAFSQSETPEDDVTAVVLKVGENGAATT